MENRYVRIIIVMLDLNEGSYLEQPLNRGDDNKKTTLEAQSDAHLIV